MADQFQTTRWSLVLEAAQGAEGSAGALAWLCETYWYPLYAFIRRQGNDADAARDLTQSFFLHLLDKQALQRIDPQQGRFRAFLLASAKNFLANERAHEQALKRRADNPAFQLGFDDAEQRYVAEPATVLGPDDLYETRWALSVLDRAMRRLEEEQESAGKAASFTRLRGHLTGEEAPYDRLARDLESTAGALRVAVHRLRVRLGALLREEVAQTVSDPRDIDHEIRCLLEAIGRAA